MTEYVEILPVNGPVQGTIRPPGSKSITNRALILAALADGWTHLTGVLDSQDTRVMVESLRRLGFEVEQDSGAGTCRVHGQRGHVPSPAASLFLENSGTSIRFLTSLCALGHGRYELDGVQRMRERPIGDLVTSLRQLGAVIDFGSAETQCPPITVDGGRGRFIGGQATIRGDISSQFLSSLLMAAPASRDGVVLTVEGELVSKPYVTMTLQMMRDFGVSVDSPEDLSEFRIAPAAYGARTYDIEPDASAASYFFALAAITGGAVTVTGLTRDAMQGDIRFVDALQRMGCQVVCDEGSMTVIGGRLQGIDVDMNDISDTAQTLSVVATFADSPTTIRNVGHMRHKETDRIAAVVTELQRAGIDAVERTDGLKIHPGPVRPAHIHTYDDHRMAMSFALLGIRNTGIRILDPGCTAKTYPNYFAELEGLCGRTFVRGQQ